MADHDRNGMQTYVADSNNSSILRILLLLSSFIIDTPARGAGPCFSASVHTSLRYYQAVMAHNPYAICILLC